MLRTLFTIHVIKTPNILFYSLSSLKTYYITKHRLKNVGFLFLNFKKSKTFIILFLFNIIIINNIEISLKYSLRIFKIYVKRTHFVTRPTHAFELCAYSVYNNVFKVKNQKKKKHKPFTDIFLDLTINHRLKTYENNNII